MTSPGASTQDGPEAGPPNSRSSCFVTTRWTLVLSAARMDQPQARTALEELCQLYWFPLYAFVRRRGYSKEDAEDLVQGFFARFLSKNYLAGLHSDRGKFRAFLLAALKHYLANERDRAGRQKRGGGVPIPSLDWQSADTRYFSDPADHLSPDKLFDRAWAIVLLERVLVRLRDENIAAGKAALFEGLKSFLTLGKESIPYPRVAELLAISEPAARVAAHRLRRRYRELLRDEIAQTLAQPGQLDDEMRSLLSAFAD